MKWDLAAIEKLANKGMKVVGLSDASKSGIKPKVSKYRSQKTSLDGIVFDSKKEACRYNELKFLQSIGEISDLQLQVVFQLTDCRYIVDFCYTTKDGIKITEDVKSAHTKKLPVYRLKKKMMFSQLGITIKEY